MHFQIYDNSFNPVFPPVDIDTVQASPIVTKKSPGRRGLAAVRSLGVLVTSFVVVFGVMYSAVTWPLVPQQANYLISQLISTEESTASAAQDPTILDSDGDGYSDGEEIAAGFDPFAADSAKLDADADGLKDTIEARYYGTDPLQNDSDGDGFTDLTEVVNGYSPLKSADYETWVEDRQRANLRIKKINVDAPVIWNNDLETIYDDLKQGVVHYRNSANPGEIGNSVIVGHSSQYLWDNNKYGTIFALLDKLKVGDQIQMDYVDKTYIYTVTDTSIAEPKDTRMFAPTNRPVLTLGSCYPAGSSAKRIWVTAELTGAQPIDR